MLHRFLILRISTVLLARKERNHLTDKTSHSYPPGLLCLALQLPACGLINLLFVHLPLCPLVCVLTEYQTNNPDRGWSPKAPLRRTSLESLSAPFEPHSPRSTNLHLPQPVPWPFRLSIRVRRLNVVVSCFRYLYIEMQPQKFVTKWSKVAFLISLLSGRALLWARAIWNSQSTLINSFDAFTAHFREVFGRPTSSLSVADQLIRLRQGSASTDDYTLQFCTLAASSGWNEAALLAVYRQGLNPQIRTMMAIYDDAVGLESFMQRAVRISQCLTACQLGETALSPASPVACPPVPEPMHVDSHRLSRTE